MGINDRCAVRACNNAFNGSLELRFYTCRNPKLYTKWGSACNRKYFVFKKHHVICSNHFEYGKPTDASPLPTLYLKGYGTDENSKKRKAPKERVFLPNKKCKGDKFVSSSTASDGNHRQCRQCR